MLADRFPHAKQHSDIRTCAGELTPTDVIIGGFPCQDVSTIGKRRGLSGERTGLFFNAIDIIKSLQPRWVVLENVTGLLSSNAGKDFQTVITTLAECGYLGYWRVLDARYFGVPTKRRRVFMVAGYRQRPPIEFMADCGPDHYLSGKTSKGWQDAHPTLLAGVANGCVDFTGANICIVRGGRGEMVKRTRTVEDDGLCKGLDETNFAEARAAGNAVCPPAARWIAQKLIKTF